MSKILVVYHSGTGNTEKMARAVVEGAQQVKGVEALLKRAAEATVEDFTSSDAYALGSPNYFDMVGGSMVDFFVKAWGVRAKAEGKASVAFSSENPGVNTILKTLEKIMGIFKMRKVAEGVVAARAPTPNDLEACRELGKKLAGSV